MDDENGGKMRAGSCGNFTFFGRVSLSVRSIRQVGAALFASMMLVNVSASPSRASTWTNENLTFNYYFPDLAHVFTGSPITFVADGSLHLSTFSNLGPATFSVTGIAPNEVQISYFYPLADYPHGVTMTSPTFNGFSISGPNGLLPIVTAFVDSNSGVTGLTDSKVSFTSDSVTVNLAGDKFPAGAVGLIDVEFAGAVPEASTWAMLIVGFAGIGLLAYRRRNGSAQPA